MASVSKELQKLMLSVICRDCRTVIINENSEKLKDGIFVDDSYYSDAVCDDCLNSGYYYDSEQDQYFYGSN